MIDRRWGSGRSQNANREKRPLLSSRGWVAIQVDRQMGWNEWQEMERSNQWKHLEELGLLITRRRPVRNITEELEDRKEKKDNPKLMEVLPECNDEEEERHIQKMNRRKRTKYPPFEVAKLQNCDIPLNEEEWRDMSIERQRGTLEVMNLLKKELGGKKEKSPKATRLNNDTSITEDNAKNNKVKDNNNKKDK